MSRHRRRITIYKSAPPAKPAAPSLAPASPDALGLLVRVLVVIVFVVGLVTLAAPWLHRSQQLPQAGVVCWHVERATADGSERSSHCEPAPGWHAERSPTAGLVVVPDDAEPVRRRWVRD